MADKMIIEQRNLGTIEQGSSVMSKIAHLDNAIDTGYRIEHGIIWGPKDSGLYWLDKGYIWGPKNPGKYRIHNGCIFGPSGNGEFSVENNHIFGPNDDLPWMK